MGSFGGSRSGYYVCGVCAAFEKTGGYTLIAENTRSEKEGVESASEACYNSVMKKEVDT